ncbi:MAG: hypothetical protein AAFX99_15730, partial [Myxococcota bacterium]
RDTSAQPRQLKDLLRGELLEGFRWFAHVAGLEDANRQLQRENLKFRTLLSGEQAPFSSADYAERRVDLLESVLTEVLDQYRHLKQANRELEQELDRQEARRAKLSALSKVQKRLLDDAQRDIEEIRASSPSVPVKASSLHRIGAVPPTSSNPDALARLKERLRAQRERRLQQDAAPVATQNTTLH